MLSSSVGSDITSTSTAVWASILGLLRSNIFSIIGNFLVFPCLPAAVAWSCPIKMEMHLPAKVKVKVLPIAGA